MKWKTASLPDFSDSHASSHQPITTMGKSVHDFSGNHVLPKRTARGPVNDLEVLSSRDGSTLTENAEDLDLALFIETPKESSSDFGVARRLTNGDVCFLCAAAFAQWRVL